MDNKQIDSGSCENCNAHKEKQIDEMAKQLYGNFGLSMPTARNVATYLTEKKGYRKADEVASESIDEFERRLYAVSHRETSITGYSYSVVDIDEIAYEAEELKKKYTVTDTNVLTNTEGEE